MVITGGTLLVTVNVRITLLEFIQLSVAVNVTSMTPQKDVMMAGEGALSVRERRPQPLSVAIKLAR